jgi:hypothetical protein
MSPGSGGPFDRLRRRLRHFDGLGDVRDFLAVGVELLRVPFDLSRLGLSRLLVRLDAPRRARGVRPVGGAALARARRLALYADVWLRYQRPPNPCLRRSLVLFGRLRRMGVPVTFCLGIRTEEPLGADGPVLGHAWLELGGQTILESEGGAAMRATTFRYPLDPPPQARFA